MTRCERCSVEAMRMRVGWNTQKVPVGLPHRDPHGWAWSSQCSERDAARPEPQARGHTMIREGILL
jgi:hypothetical protein